MVNRVINHDTQVRYIYDVWRPQNLIWTERKVYGAVGSCILGEKAGW